MFTSKTITYSQDALVGKVGENIYGAFAIGPLDYIPHTATDYWYQQEANYNYTTGKAEVEGTSIWEFTSMIWAGVENVGFGYAYGPGSINGQDGTLIYIVAKYSPTPNIVDQFIQNIGVPGGQGQGVDSAAL